MADFVKENSIKNSIITLLGVLLGASLMPAIEYFYVHQAINLFEVIIRTMVIALSATTGFMIFRWLFSNDKTVKNTWLYISDRIKQAPFDYAQARLRLPPSHKAVEAKYYSLPIEDGFCIELLRM